VLTAKLYLWNEQEGKGVVFDSSAGFRLPDTSVYGPDAAWVQKWKWDALTEEQRERFAPLCPDVIFEIVSRTDSRREARERIDAFRSNGAFIAVLIDPYQRWVEINGDRRDWERIELRFPGCGTAFVLDPSDLE
jgi:Uma2 family endonuclease